MNNTKRRAGGAQSVCCRAAAVLLCLTMLVAPLCFGIAARATDEAGGFTIRLDDREVESVTLPQDGKIVLTAPAEADAAYTWQLCVDKEADAWVRIFGQTQNFLTLSYAMVGSLLNTRGETYARCVMTSGGEVRASAPVKVTVSYTVSQTGQAEDGSGQPLQTAALRAEAAPDDFKAYTVTVNFVYENGDLAYAPYVASIEAGGAFTDTVRFPSVAGYLPYFEEEAESRTEYTVSIPEMTGDVQYTVTYKPTIVPFLVHHYGQNILDDNYVLLETTEHEGLTGTPVGGGCAIDIAGYTVLYYDRDTKIAADGSTEIEIYYDRNYYLLSFDLDGGYGVEPIYTRYGTTVSVDRPTRPGYLFDGWELIECGGEAATDAQKSQYTLNQNSLTTPAQNLKYKAKWRTADTTYTVVYWVENADDEGYSYHTHETVTAVSGTTADGSAYNTKTIEHFTFDDGKTDQSVIVEGDGSTVVNVYYKRNLYTLTFRATVYDCGYEEHTHTYDGRYRSGRTWYYYGGCYPEGSSGTGGAASGNTVCGKTAHTHSWRCGSHLGTVAEITAPYDSKIFDAFGKAPFSTTYAGRAWECTDSSKYGYALQTLDRMPGFDATFTLYDQSSDTQKTIYYYVQKVGTAVDAGVWPTSNENFDLLKEVSTYFNYATYDEEYHKIKGFTRYSERASGFDYNEKDFTDNILNLYYLRSSYALKFYNYNDFVPGREHILQYEAPLDSYNFTPDYPAELEPEAYTFAGWFTTPQCFSGSEVDFAAATMPDADLTLYAKWEPKVHTVRVFTTAGMTDAELLNTQQIAHGRYAKAPAEVTNGNYVFCGWFYMDGAEKKAFDFNNMPINRDLDIFAEWSSQKMVLYTVRYQLEDGTEIAATTVGSTLAGMSKTFTAKGGGDLYSAYREGYFPTTNSHTLLMRIDGENQYTFVYVHKEKVGYTVRYLLKENGQPVPGLSEKTGETNMAVLTEVFERAPGYMPDAYQKRLVLSANEEENVLTFWYTRDSEHAYYVITHWVQNLEGDGYTEYRTVQGPEKLGTLVEEAPLSLSGFSYNAAISTASGVLTADGLRLDLYYDRNLYGYTVKYLEIGTERELRPETAFEAIYRYGRTVSAEAAEIPGYTLVGDKTKTRTIHDTGNEIRFYYTEQEVTIKYLPVGQGTVSRGSETIRASSGTASGALPSPAPGYWFDGWYTDAACTQPVLEGWVDAAGCLTPQQEAGLYRSATYYAKFSPATAALTIQKSGWDAADENQTFLFRVRGRDENTGGIDITVTVHGGGETTVTDLPLGAYTVCEAVDWSWRYTPEQAQQAVQLPEAGAALLFANSRTEVQWLDGGHYKLNLFGKTD